MLVPARLHDRWRRVDGRTQASNKLKNPELCRLLPITFINGALLTHNGSLVPSSTAAGAGCPRHSPNAITKAEKKDARWSNWAQRWF